MDLKRTFSLSCSILTCSLATAGTMGGASLEKGIQSILSVQGGYSANNLGSSSKIYVNALADTFTYYNKNNSTSTGFIGGFIGAEVPFSWLPHPGMRLQTGVEYNYFGSAHIAGVNTVGLEPALATVYQYNYQVQTQQVLGIIKLLATTYERFYPYGEVGLGAAFNKANRYRATTTDAGVINLTPYFIDQTNSQFSYSLGVGVDMQMMEKIRVGLGYRYSNFGTPSLGAGAVTYGSYSYPVPFRLNNVRADANQLLARISYIA